ncbi:lipocalin family protein, partial [Candidatus Ozemobacteraceae bacterium]|nr:lipocalin family protein [Candidatus Ozemobacteraceae bacterium]
MAQFDKLVRRVFSLLVLLYMALSLAGCGGGGGGGGIISNDDQILADQLIGKWKLINKNHNLNELKAVEPNDSGRTCWIEFRSDNSATSVSYTLELSDGSETWITKNTASETITGKWQISNQRLILSSNFGLYSFDVSVLDSKLFVNYQDGDVDIYERFDGYVTPEKPPEEQKDDEAIPENPFAPSNLERVSAESLNIVGKSIERTFSSGALGMQLPASQRARYAVMVVNIGSVASTVKMNGGGSTLNSVRSSIAAVAPMARPVCGTPFLRNA